MEKKRVTLKDVAEQARVSVATVSIVLNGKRQMRITEETRQRVLDTARALNYQPDLSAQMLKGKTSSIIGLVIPDILNPFYPELVRGTTDKAGAYGYNVILFNSDNKFHKEEFFLETMRSLRVAGVLVCGADDGGEQEARLLRELGQSGIPVVLVDRGDRESGFHSVIIENREAAFEAAGYLLKGGHSRIAFAATSSVDVVKIIEERFHGYRDAMAAYGAEVGRDLLYQSVSTGAESAMRLVKKLMRAKPRITAVVASGDILAIDIIRAAKEIGYRIPEDLSVIGFDDIQMASMIDPPLTTIAQPKYEMGEISMIVLNSIIREELVAQKTVVLKPKFVVRASSCALYKPASGNKR